MDKSRFLRANANVIARIQEIKKKNNEEAKAKAKAEAEAVEKESTIKCLDASYDDNIKCE